MEMQFKVKILMGILPINFDHIVTAIEESKDLWTPSMHEEMGSLQIHEKERTGFSNLRNKHSAQS